MSATFVSFRPPGAPAHSDLSAGPQARFSARTHAGGMETTESRIRARDRALRLLNRITTAAALAAVAGVGLFGAVSAATIPGTTSASTTGSSSSTTASNSITASGSLQASSGVSSSSSGSGVAVSGASH